MCLVLFVLQLCENASQIIPGKALFSFQPSKDRRTRFRAVGDAVTQRVRQPGRLPISYVSPFLSSTMSKAPTRTESTVIQEAEAEIRELADENVDTVDTNARYAAYGARLRTALRATSR